MTNNEIAELKRKGLWGPFFPEEYGLFATEFGLFLKNHKCAKSYLFELKRRQPEVDFFFKNHIPEDYICCAFIYYKSIKGLEYWNKIEELWLKELENLKSKKS